MSDTEISKEDLKKEISEILKDADLTKISSKKVRQQIEDRLDINLTSRKKEVDELVMSYIQKPNSKVKGGKKNGDVNESDGEDEEDAQDAEEDEESEEEVKKKPKRGAAAKKPAVKRKKDSSEESESVSDDEGDDEYNPKKKSSKKPKGRGAAAGRKKKSASSDDSDEDWGKGKKRAKKAAGGAKRAGGGGGYTKAMQLSPELSHLLGEESMPRHEVVKRIWAIIKERNLYNEEQTKENKTAPNGPQMKENTTAQNEQQKKANKTAQNGQKKENKIHRPVKLSPELAKLVGVERLARHLVVKKVWAIIKEKNMFDPKNKQFTICDDDMRKVFGVDRFRTFGMLKYLKNHFIVEGAQ